MSVATRAGWIATRAAAEARGQEWPFVAAVSLTLLLVSSVPTLIGYLAAPEGKWFAGIAGNVHDTAQYLSWMREAERGLLIEDRLTSEPNPAVFLNLHWWLPGRAAALAGVSILAAYHLFRLLATVLYVLVASWFFGLLFRDPARRRFALLLSTFTSGLGWIWVVDKRWHGRRDVLYPFDLYPTQGNTLQLATISPHQIFALALTVGVIGLAWLGYERASWRPTLAASALALFLGLGHIYDLVTIWSALGAFGLLLVLRDGLSRRVLLHLSPVVLLSAPAPLYFWWLSSAANPTWQRALVQYDNLGVHTPDPIHLVVLLGLTFVVAAVGLVSDRRPLRAQSSRDLLVKGWLVSNLVIVYLPIKFEIMLLACVQVVMAVLATDWLYGRLVPWLRARWPAVDASRWAAVAFLALVVPTNLYLIAWRSNDVLRAEYPFYLSDGDVRALGWLEANSDRDDVVLSSFSIGHYLPGLTGRRAYLSNAVMTLDFVAKRDRVARFFDADADDAWRRRFLADAGVAYLLYGPAERSLGGFDPAGSSLFRPVFASGGTTVYRLTS